MLPYLLLAWVISWSCVWTSSIPPETTTNLPECNEPLITQCQCGENGRYQDVYVSSCQVYTSDNSSLCQPCPGSCGAYGLCQTCSKEGCLSCPPGRRGQFCEMFLPKNAEHTEENNLDYSEAPGDEMKPKTEEKTEKQIFYRSQPIHDIPVNHRIPEKPFKGLKNKGKLMKFMSYGNPIAVTNTRMPAVTNGNAKKSSSGMEYVHYADVFGSNSNPEISRLLSNKTEKFTSVQKSKETLTVLHDSLRENEKSEFLPLVAKNENETDIDNGKLINGNIDESDTFSKSDAVFHLSTAISFSENIFSDLKDNFEEIRKENLDEMLDTSSSRRNTSFVPSEVRESYSLDENENLNDNSSSHRNFPNKFSEVLRSANSENNEKVNSSSRFEKSNFMSPEVYENHKLEEKKNLNSSPIHWFILPGKDKASNSDNGEKLNSSSIHLIFPCESSKVKERTNSDDSKKLNSSFSYLIFPNESSKVQESPNSDDDKKLNSSFSQRKFPYEFSDVQETREGGKYDFDAKIMDDQPSEQKSNEQTGRLFEKEANIKDIKFPSLPFSYGKESFQDSEPENESLKMINESKISKLNPMGYRVAFAFGKSGLEGGKFSQLSSNKQSDSSKMVSELPEKEVPLNISVFKLKIIDTEGNLGNINSELTDASREQVEKDRITKSELYENNSKPYDIVSPLAINIFKITFLSKDSDSQFGNSNSNITDEGLFEYDTNSNISETTENKAQELPENIAVGFKAAGTQNQSAFRITILKENAGSSADKKSLNIPIKPSDDTKGANSNEKKANYKRNATKRSYDRLPHDTNALDKIILKSTEFFVNKPKTSDDDKLHDKKSFSKTKYDIPANNIFKTLYFPEMHEAGYRSSSLDNGQLPKLCDLYPNYSPCFRVRMLLPESPYIDAFDSQSQIQSRYNHHKNSPNVKYFHHFPQATFYDSVGKMDRSSSSENDQNRLRDSEILALLKEYIQSKIIQSTSSLLSQKSKPLDTTYLSGQSDSPNYLVQSWNKEKPSEEGFDSAFMNGFINYFLGLSSPIIGAVAPAAQPSLLSKQKYYKSKAEQSVPSREIIEFPLYEPFPNSFSYRYIRPFGIVKPREIDPGCSSEESSVSIENQNSTSKIFPESADRAQIKTINPMFVETAFEYDDDKRDKLNLLDSGEDAFLESCAKCVFTESVYEPVGDEKRENSLPTIFRMLIVEEEGMMFGNISDSESQNASRSRRSPFTYGTENWCPIERKMLNGNLDCTIWTYQKVCTLKCHRGYTNKALTFRCSHRTNTWEPYLTPCTPAIQYSSFGYRSGSDSSKEDGFNYLPDRGENNKNIENYNYPPVDNKPRFENMEVDNQEASFPNYEPPAIHNVNYGRNQDVRNTSLEIKGDSRYDQNHHHSYNATSDVRVDSKFDSVHGFPGYGVSDTRRNSTFENNRRYPGYEVLNGKDNSTFDNDRGYPGYEVLNGKDNSTFENFQSFPGDMTVGRNPKFDAVQSHAGYKTVDGRNDSNFENVQGFQGYMTTGRRKNSSFDNNHGFPGYEELDGKDNSTFDNAYDSEFFSIKAVPDKDTLIGKSELRMSKSRDFPEVVVRNGKDIGKKVMSEEEIRKAERIFDMYEKKEPTLKSISNKKHLPVEESPVVEKTDQDLDTVYSFFEKQNPEPGKDGLW